MRIAKRVIILLAITLIIGGASVVLAASAESNAAAPPDVAMRQGEDPPPPPEVPTPTLTTHPVGAAIAKFFGITDTEVISLHNSGVGFGVIARAYMTAKFSNGQLTPEEVLELFQSGTGWGQIMKEYGVHPGGKGLGAIMGHKGGKPPSDGAPDPGDTSCQGNRCNAPGHDKSGKGPKK